MLYLCVDCIRSRVKLVTALKVAHHQWQVPFEHLSFEMWSLAILSVTYTFVLAEPERPLLRFSNQLFAILFHPYVPPNIPVPADKQAYVYVSKRSFEVRTIYSSTVHTVRKENLTNHDLCIPVLIAIHGEWFLIYGCSSMGSFFSFFLIKGLWSPVVSLGVYVHKYLNAKKKSRWFQEGELSKTLLGKV